MIIEQDRPLITEVNSSEKEIAKQRIVATKIYIKDWLCENRSLDNFLTEIEISGDQDFGDTVLGIDPNELINILLAELTVKITHEAIMKSLNEEPLKPLEYIVVRSSLSELNIVLQNDNGTNRVFLAGDDTVQERYVKASE